MLNVEISAVILIDHFGGAAHAFVSGFGPKRGSAFECSPTAYFSSTTAVDPRALITCSFCHSFQLCGSIGQSTACSLPSEPTLKGWSDAHRIFLRPRVRAWGSCTSEIQRWRANAFTIAGEFKTRKKTFTTTVMKAAQQSLHEATGCEQEHAPVRFAWT